MSGMADAIEMHVFDSVGFACSCGVLCGTAGDSLSYPQHVAEELTKAGFGNVQAALLSAADEMPIETLLGADKASVWLRERAYAADPQGRALVQAIHDRKAEE